MQQRMAMEAACKLFFSDHCVPTPMLVLHNSRKITISDDLDAIVSRRLVNPNRLYTWKATPCVWITLFQTSVGTVAMVHENGNICNLNKCFTIDKKIPPNSILQAQIVFDHNVIHNIITPRIMIFDMLQFGSESIRHLSPTARYAILREKAAHCSWSPSLQIQWAGNGASAIEFCETSSLPHATDYVFEYDEEDPYNLFKIGYI
jgi:hypothetical protein